MMKAACVGMALVLSLTPLAIAQKGDETSLFLKCDVSGSEGPLEMPVLNEIIYFEVLNRSLAEKHAIAVIDEYAVAQNLVCVGSDVHEQAELQTEASLIICDFSNEFFIASGEFEGANGRTVRRNFQINRISARISDRMVYPDTDLHILSYSGTCEPFTPKSQVQQF